jgi:hypothetical protein
MQAQDPVGTAPPEPSKAGRRRQEGYKSKERQGAISCEGLRQKFQLAPTSQVDIEAEFPADTPSPGVSAIIALTDPAPLSACADELRA